MLAVTKNYDLYNEFPAALTKQRSVLGYRWINVAEPATGRESEGESPHGLWSFLKDEPVLTNHATLI